MNGQKMKPFPQNAELAERYQTNRTTVRKAIEHLRQKAICIVNMAAGTFLFFLGLAAVPSASFMGSPMISSRVKERQSSRSLNLASFPSMNLFVMHYSFPVTPRFAN